MATASAAFKVQCPSCEAKVTVKDPSLAGKKIDCPKCKYRFVVQAPSDGAASDDGSAKTSALGAKVKAKGESANGTAKSKNKPLPKAEGEGGDGEGKKKKKKEKKGGMSPTVMIGGGVGLIAIIVLICFFAGVFNSDEGSGGGGGSGDPAENPNPGYSKNQNPNQGQNNNQGKKNQGGGKNQPAPTEKPEDFARKDPSNYLPNESQFVLTVQADRFMKTPIGAVFFDESSDSAAVFQRCMGFSAQDVDRFICAGGVDAPWFFGVFSLKKDIRLDDLKAAMELDPKPKEYRQPVKGKTKVVEKPRELYSVRSNEIVKMLGDYLAAKLPTFGVNLPQSGGNRSYAISIVDSRTLVLADQPVLERFLQGNAKPKLLTEYMPPSSSGGMEPGMMNPPEGENPPEGMNPPEGEMPGGEPINPLPMEGQNPMPMGPRGGTQGGQAGKGSGLPTTTNPSFLTIDRSLRSVILRLQDEISGSVLIFGAKLSDSHKTLGGLVQQYGAAAGIAINLIPKQTVVGLGIRKMDDSNLHLQVAIEYPDAKDAYELAQNQIIQRFAQYLASELTQMTKELVGVGQATPTEPGTGTGPEGMPINPGPIGPGPGSGIPGPVGPGGGRPGGRPPGSEGSALPTPSTGSTLVSGSEEEEDEDIFLIAQRPLPGGPGPGPSGPGPGPIGPSGPGPIGPGGPGPIGPEPNPNYPPAPKSFVSISSSDKLLLIDVQIDWKAKYYDHISPSIRSHVDQIKGEAMMMTGRAHWHSLASTIKNFEKPGLLPMGAYPRKSNPARFDLPYPPDERVSWMCDLLPYLGYDGLSRRIKRDMPWNQSDNLLAGSAWISEFLNPEFPQETWRSRVPSLRGRDLGATHFVGLTGIDMNSGEFPDTPEFAKKLGLFGWNRQTKLADVTDGLSNTIYMIQAPPVVARPWMRGGGSTAQGVPETGSLQPFVAQLKDRRGAYVLMADGSVRFLKEGIADPVFQAMVTYKAGDQIGDIEQVAPKEKGRTAVANTPPIAPMAEPKKN